MIKFNLFTYSCEPGDLRVWGRGQNKGGLGDGSCRVFAKDLQRGGQGPDLHPAEGTQGLMGGNLYVHDALPQVRYQKTWQLLNTDWPSWGEFLKRPLDNFHCSHGRQLGANSLITKTFIEISNDLTQPRNTQNNKHIQSVKCICLNTNVQNNAIVMRWYCNFPFHQNSDMCYLSMSRLISVGL